MCQFILLITYIKFLASSNHLRHLAAQNQNVYNLKPNLARWTKYMLNTRVTILITLRHLSYSPQTQQHRCGHNTFGCHKGY